MWKMLLHLHVNQNLMMMMMRINKIKNCVFRVTRLCLTFCGKFLMFSRSKKRIKEQNFCQTIEYLLFHRSGYLSNDRYVIILSLSCATFCINKNRKMSGGKNKTRQVKDHF